ncbi:AraC family transcriptional regulator [Poseidonocella sp. HB161398]|uniref:helix-turn-helix domain-containing protein n=1 Tax=Poseidonocella sp. HB161398 TaxID=2320855 RepID=UPI00110901EC|nr:AraC family transcriptional regulator [Poseidonocella sp. HB161398]
MTGARLDAEDFKVPADWVRSAIRISGAGSNLVARVLGAAGIDPAALEGEDAVIGQRQEATFFHALCDQAGDPYYAAELGLRMPGRTSTLLSYVIHGSRSLGVAMEAASRFLKLARPGLHMEFEREDGAGLWVIRSPDPWLQHLPAYQEFAVSAIIADFRSATQSGLRPESVVLPAASRGHEARLSGLWGCPVLAQADQLVVTFGPGAMALPLHRHDPDLQRHLERYGELLLQSAPEVEVALTHSVEEAVLAHLPEGGAPALAVIAADLGLSTRTLNRRLSAEGQSYRELVEEVRRRKAKLMLGDRSLRLAEIAFLLGYSEQSSFTNAFRRWTGLSPGAYRSGLAR